MAVHYQQREIHFTDLPGIYGFGGHSPEEILVNDFLCENPPDVIMLVVDAMNFERSLYLLLETLERYRQVMVVLNKMDVAAEQDVVIYHDRLEEELHVPVLPEIATGRLNTDELFLTVFQVAEGVTPTRSYTIRYNEKVERAIALVESGEMLTAECGSKRWREVHSVALRDSSMQTEIIGTRYNIAADLKDRMSKSHPPHESYSDSIDHWMLHPIWGIPLMLAIFGMLFFLTFTISRPVSIWVTDGFDVLGEWLGPVLAGFATPRLLVSLLVDGVLKGVGATMGFLPQMALFFMFYTLIQDSGYLVRVVFLVDRIMTAMGMAGKTFLPLVLGCSCNVNGILASRILSSRYDRTVAILVSSYAPCPARLGVMVFLVSAFFNSLGATLVMLSLLGISLSLMIFIAFVVRFFIPREGESSFMMELPPYQAPTWKSLTASTVWMTINFLQRIRNVIILASIIMWALSTFPQGPFEETYIAQAGKWLEPFGNLMGLSWQLIVALLLGIAAKESALSGLGIIYHAANDTGSLAQILASNITPLTAFTFLLVYMIYTPCLTTLVTMYQETRDWRIVAYGALGSFVSAIVLGIVAFNIGRVLF